MRPAILVFTVLTCLYMATANWGPRGAWNDTVAASIGAHAIASTGSPVLHDPALVSRIPWMVGAADGGSVPNRFPGAMYLAAPVYVLAGHGLSLAPGTAVAVLTTAAGAVLLGFSLRRRHGTSVAVVTALMIGVATPAWGIASQALWTHGPALLWLGAAAMALSRNRVGWAGAALGAAVFTRPHLAVVPLVAAVHLSWSRRSWGPLLGLSTSLWGAAAYLGYNRAMFDAWTVMGGYGDGPAARLAATNPLQFLYALAAGTLSPSRGLVVQTPLVLGTVLPGAWRQAPDWVQGLGLGVAAYLGLTWAAIGWLGGTGQETYRYAAETVAVVLLIAVPALLELGRRLLVALAVGVSVTVQAAAAVWDGPSTVARDAFGMLSGDWIDVPASTWFVAGLVGGAMAVAIAIVMTTASPLPLMGHCHPPTGRRRCP